MTVWLSLLVYQCGGKVLGRSFGVPELGAVGAPFDVVKLRETLPAIADRLAGVIIENLA